MAAQILTIAARSSATKGRRDPLILVLMEKALQLDPENMNAKNYIASFEWMNFHTLLDELLFPRFVIQIIGR